MPRIAKKAADFRPKSELEQIIEAEEAEFVPDDGAPSISPLAEDALNAPPKPVAPDLPVLPPIVEKGPVPLVAAGEIPGPTKPPPWALDDAPVGSKLVVLSFADKGKTPVLVTPRGEMVLSLNDISFKLPVGAKIRRVAEGRFVAEQLNSPKKQDPLETLTGREAVTQFVPYFHG